LPPKVARFGAPPNFPLLLLGFPLQRLECCGQIVLFMLWGQSSRLWVSFGKIPFLSPPSNSIYLRVAFFANPRFSGVQEAHCRNPKLRLSTLDRPLSRHDVMRVPFAELFLRNFLLLLVGFIVLVSGAGKTT
jgi:hypothetical protein